MITILTLLQSTIATVEVVKISELRALEAAIWGALNATCYIIGIVVIVDEPRHKLLIPFYIAAATIATFVGTLIGKYLTWN